MANGPNDEGLMFETSEEKSQLEGQDMAGWNSEPCIPLPHVGLQWLPDVGL